MLTQQACRGLSANAPHPHLGSASVSHSRLQPYDANMCDNNINTEATASGPKPVNRSAARLISEVHESRRFTAQVLSNSQPLHYLVTIVCSFRLGLLPSQLISNFRILIHNVVVFR
jgi:hypothetical protein